MLADRLQGELSQKSNTVKTNGTEVNTQATTNIINGVNVAGYKIKHKVLELESGSLEHMFHLSIPQMVQMMYLNIRQSKKPRIKRTKL